MSRLLSTGRLVQKPAYLSAIPVLAVLLGGSIYILFRPGPTLFFHWISHIDWVPRDFLLSAPLSHLSGVLPGWVIYSLPNGLWAFAYSLTIIGLWAGVNSRIRYVWIATIPLLVFGFELLQLFDLRPGTFCVQDLLSSLLGILAGWWIWKMISPKQKRKEYED